MKLSLLLTGFLFTLACHKNDLAQEVSNTTAVTQTNVAYGTNPKQKMDIYLPAGRTTNLTKVLVVIHGGGWTGGDKAEFNPYIDVLQQELPDYAIFNLNYRLASGGTNLFPAQENDIKAAIQFIFSKRADY